MEQKTSQEINEKRISPYKLLSYPQTSSSETQYSNNQEKIDTEKAGITLNVVNSTSLGSDQILDSTRTVPPVATISPRIKMR